MREAKLLYFVPNSFGFGTSKSAISDLKNQQFARALTTEDFGTMRGAGSVLKLVLIVSTSPMAMSKTCLASWRADALGLADCH
jgi:hypothetical protein